MHQLGTYESTVGASVGVLSLTKPPDKSPVGVVVGVLSLTTKPEELPVGASVGDLPVGARLNALFKILISITTVLQDLGHDFLMSKGFFGDEDA